VKRASASPAVVFPPRRDCSCYRSGRPSMRRRSVHPDHAALRLAEREDWPAFIGCSFLTCNAECGLAVAANEEPFARDHHSRVTIRYLCGQMANAPNGFDMRRYARLVIRSLAWQQP
jgi:hypothetical protein